LKQLEPAAILARMDEGLPKMFVVHQSLTLRREHPEYFGAEAAYLPVLLEGPRAEHGIAYLRGDRVLTVVPRHWLSLRGDWQGTTIQVPEGTWRNRFTGESFEGGIVPLANLLQRFPVALLVREGD
jgi:(1->4)-alpha-D-glucan 1-alpha-D-glucosylmutase